MRDLHEHLAERQERFYEALGATAFHGTVPFRLSTSRAMAKLVLEAARTFARAQGKARICLVDLGAGSGRLGFQLARLAGEAELRLALADASGSMVASWALHPALAGLAAAGRVSFHQVRLEEAASLEALLAHGADEALVVVNTYLLDSLPHALVEAPLARLARVSEGGALEFGEPTSDTFLRSWAARLGHGVAFVPTGAFAMVRALEARLDAPVLLLCADKGARSLDEAREGGALRLARHGAGASVLVNFEALRSWLGWRGWVEAPGNDADFVIGATLLARGSSALEGLAAAMGSVPHPLAAQRAITTLRGAERAQLVAGVLALEPDADVVLELADSLVGAAEDCPPSQREALGAWLLEAVREAFFLPTDDVAFHAGRVLHRLGFAGAAVSCFGHSLQHHGDVVSSRFNLAVCLLELGDRVRGGQMLEAVLAREPGHAQALELMKQLASEPPAGSAGFRPRRGEQRER